MNRLKGYSNIWFLGLLLVTFLSGCGNSDNTPADATAKETKAITSYSLDGATGIIAESAKVILVTLPNGTPLEALVAKFTHTGDSVYVGAESQTSASTPNDFSANVEYTVTAEDLSQTVYTVKAIAAPDYTHAITSYSIQNGAVFIDEAVKTISVTMPAGTDKTALVATFITTGKFVDVIATGSQESGVTVNDFSAPVDYLVTAGNATEATYTVTVTVHSALGPYPVNLGTAGNFVILSKSGVSTTVDTDVVGDIGVSPAAATYITGFDLILDSTETFSISTLVDGSIFASDYMSPTPAKMTTAVSDMEIAFTDAAGRSNTDHTELYAGDISGQTLVPGLYKWGTGVLITSAGVTLEGGADDVWIFQIAQDLTVDNSAIVTLLGGCPRI